MIDTILWVTGLATWFALATIGGVHVFDYALDWIINTFWSRRECVAFVCDRLTSKRKQSA